MLTSRSRGSARDFGEQPPPWMPPGDSVTPLLRRNYGAVQQALRPTVPHVAFRWPDQKERPFSGGLAVAETYQRLGPPTSWLASVLRALGEVPDEIAEDELPEINAVAMKEAERIIRGLARYPQPPTVYPTQDAEIAIHFRAADSPDSVVILLSDSGQADCYAYTSGRSRHAHYDAPSDLPDDFVMAQLRALAPSAPPTSRSGIGASNILFLPDPLNGP